MPSPSFEAKGEHLPLSVLKEKVPDNQYLKKDYIETFPRPELLVEFVSHSTDLPGLKGIGKDGGFKDPRWQKFMWLSLQPSPHDLREAETRDMILVHPGGQEETANLQATVTETQENNPPGQGRSLENLQENSKSLFLNNLLENILGNEPEDLPTAAEAPPTAAEAPPAAAEAPPTGILRDFASSPAFRSRSRYGSFRFTFSLERVLDKYSQQFCAGQEPVLRVFLTHLYKQEVVYVVLVHSPDQNEKFSELPLLEETPHCICAFRADPEPRFIWRPQAMCETHRWTLVQDDLKKLRVERVSGRPEFYVWDHVTLALDVGSEILKFEQQELQESLRFCEKDRRPIRNDISYQTYDEAKTEVTKLWPGLNHLQEFNKSEFHITD